MLDFILTAKHKYRSYERYIEQCVKQRYTIAAKIEWGNPTGAPLSAYILRGAWVVSCECGETLFYEPAKTFFCPNCLNADNSHQVRIVNMPIERDAIEQLLLMRPNPQNRNWLIGELVENLIAENAIMIALRSNA